MAVHQFVSCVLSPKRHAVQVVMLYLVLVLEFLQVAAQKSEPVLGLCHLSVVVRV